MATGQSLTLRNIGIDDKLPECDVYPYDTTDSRSILCLLPFITKNKIGRGPPAEARHFGNADLTTSLGDIIPRLNPDGIRLTEANVANMVEFVEHDHLHN